MDLSLKRIMHNLGRGMVGALLLGTPFLFTMETWWLGWRLPLQYLVVFGLAGLAIILVLVRSVGFKVEERGWYPDPSRLAADVAELMLECFAAAYLILVLFGVVGLNDSFYTVARIGLIQIVPLGLGAAIANHVLRAGEEGADEAPFPKDIALSALGALFFSIPIAPTEEVELMAARAGWLRLAFVVLLTIVITYVALYELEFRGIHGRLRGMSHAQRWGSTALAYATAFIVASLLLAGLGHFTGQPPSVWVQLTIVLSFPAAIGGAAARVVL